MGATPQQQIELEAQIKAAEKKVMVGTLYVHYKSAEKVYKVLGLGVIEADDSLCVIYQAQYGKRLTFVRPLTSWHETVDWNSKTIPRFSPKS